MNGFIYYVNIWIPKTFTYRTQFMIQTYGFSLKFKFANKLTKYCLIFTISNSQNK